MRELRAVRNEYFFFIMAQNERIDITKNIIICVAFIYYVYKAFKPNFCVQKLTIIDIRMNTRYAKIFLENFDLFVISPVCHCTYIISTTALKTWSLLLLNSFATLFRCNNLLNSKTYFVVYIFILLLTLRLPNLSGLSYGGRQ